jgi:hypothetical protein
MKGGGRVNSHREEERKTRKIEKNSGLGRKKG